MLSYNKTEKYFLSWLKLFNQLLTALFFHHVITSVISIHVCPSCHMECSQRVPQRCSVESFYIWVTQHQLLVSPSLWQGFTRWCVFDSSCETPFVVSTFTGNIFPPVFCWRIFEVARFLGTKWSSEADGWLSLSDINHLSFTIISCFFFGG